MERDQVLRQVKEASWELEPNAKVILYGSRSRGAAGLESDRDFLILVDGPVDDARTDRFRHRLCEIEGEGDEVISSIRRGRSEWDSPRYKVTPFRQVVEREGISL